MPFARRCLVNHQRNERTPVWKGLARTLPTHRDLKDEWIRGSEMLLDPRRVELHRVEVAPDPFIVSAVVRPADRRLVVVDTAEARPGIIMRAQAIRLTPDSMIEVSLIVGPVRS